MRIRDGWAVGGGIFAKTAKTPPLQSGVCGDIIAIRIVLKGRPLVPPCVYHAAHGDPGFYHDAAPNRDAARHVATNALPPYAHARPTATVCAYHATPHPPMNPWFLQRRGTPRRYGLRIIASA